MKKHKIKAMTLSLGLILLILTLGSSISMATNSRLICSAAEAVSCSKDGECIRGPVDKVNLPLFFQVDETVFLQICAIYSTLSSY